MLKRLQAALGHASLLSGRDLYPALHFEAYITRADTTAVSGERYGGFSMTTHFAYLDPGTGTLIVQALLGGTAGVAVLFKTKRSRLARKNKAEETAATDADATEADESTEPIPSAD